MAITQGTQCMDTQPLEMHLVKARVMHWDDALVIAYPTEAVYAARDVDQLLPPQMRVPSAQGEYHIGVLVEAGDGALLVFTQPDFATDYRSARLLILTMAKVLGHDFMLALVQKCNQTEYQAVRDFTTANNRTLGESGTPAFNIYAGQTVPPGYKKH